MCLLDEVVPKPKTESAYRKVEQDLTQKCEALKEMKDATAMQSWAHKMQEWHDTLAPVFNMLRTVTVPSFFHSTRNRTLLRIVFGLERHIGYSEVFLIDLRHSRVSADSNNILPTTDQARCNEAFLGLVIVNLNVIATIVGSCALIQYYVGQARNLGVKDIDDWAGY